MIEVIQLVCLGLLTVTGLYEFIQKRIDKKYKYEYHLFDRDHLLTKLSELNDLGTEIVYSERVDTGRWIFITRKAQ